MTQPTTLYRFYPPKATRSTLRKEAEMDGQGNIVQLEQFHGLPSEDGEEWLERFSYYAQYKAITADSQASMFPVMLRGKAYKWLRSLPPARKATIQAIRESFKERYGKRKKPATYAAELFVLKQGPQEEIADYVTSIRKLSEKAEMAEEMALQAALKGLDSKLKPFFSRNPPESLEQLLQEAEEIENNTDKESKDNGSNATLVAAVS